MTERYFPDLPPGFIGTLTTIRAIVLDDPSCLDAPECPYPDEDKRLLRLVITSPGGVQRPAYSETEDYSEDFDDGDLSDDKILASVEDLFRGLRDFGKEMDGVKDPKDKAAYFRVAASLTDKLLAQRERATRLKDWNSFMTQLMAWLENVEPDQRTDLMDRIKDWT